MLIKNPKPAYRKWLKRGALTLFVVEAGCFIGSYFVWHKINTERDSRKYLSDNFPQILDWYYKTGEIIDKNNKTREIDAAYWTSESYGLYVATSPSEHKIQELRKTLPPVTQAEREKTKKLLEQIEAAANIRKN